MSTRTLAAAAKAALAHGADGVTSEGRKKFLLAAETMAEGANVWVARAAYAFHLQFPSDRKNAAYGASLAESFRAAQAAGLVKVGQSEWKKRVHTGAALFAETKVLTPSTVPTDREREVAREARAAVENRGATRKANPDDGSSASTPAGEGDLSGVNGGAGDRGVKVTLSPEGQALALLAQARDAIRAVPEDERTTGALDRLTAALEEAYVALAEWSDEAQADEAQAA